MCIGTMKTKCLYMIIAFLLLWHQDSIAVQNDPMISQWTKMINKIKGCGCEIEVPKEPDKNNFKKGIAEELSKLEEKGLKLESSDDEITKALNRLENRYCTQIKTLIDKVRDNHTAIATAIDKIDNKIFALLIQAGYQFDIISDYMWREIELSREQENNLRKIADCTDSMNELLQKIATDPSLNNKLQRIEKDVSDILSKTNTAITLIKDPESFLNRHLHSIDTGIQAVNKKIDSSRLNPIPIICLSISGFSYPSLENGNEGKTTTKASMSIGAKVYLNELLWGDDSRIASQDAPALSWFLQGELFFPRIRTVRYEAAPNGTTDWETNIVQMGGGLTFVPLSAYRKVKILLSVGYLLGSSYSSGLQVDYKGASLTAGFVFDDITPKVLRMPINCFVLLNTWRVWQGYGAKNMFSETLTPFLTVGAGVNF